MSAMQKVQAAAGNKPLGPNGQPSPAQMDAMRVCSQHHTSLSVLRLPRDAEGNAT